MPEKLSEKKIKLIQNLREKGLSVLKIAQKARVSYTTAYGYTRARERGFRSLGEYQKYLIGERGFKSRTEYRNYLAKQRGFESRNKYDEYLLKRRRFKNRKEYREYLARKNGFESYSDYCSWHCENLAREKGFKSSKEYYEHQVRERQQKPVNKKLSKLVKSRLKQLGKNEPGKNQRWLAKKLGITEAAVSRYASGKTTPRKNLQEKIFKTLELPYKKLEDLL